MPLVSVLMPVFNRETLVGDAIRSIQNQVLDDWELIILDDASTDRTLEVCRSFESQDRRIRVFANERNLGVGQTRHRLTSYSTGKYIAVQDSDDISVPERLALQVEVLETKPEIGLVSGLTALLDDDGRIFMYAPERLYRGEQCPQDKRKMVELLYQCKGYENSSYMFRHSLLGEIPDPYDNYRIVDDWHFFLHAAHRTLIWGIPKVLVKVRRGKSHMHVWKDQTAGQIEILRIKRAMCEYYKADPNSPIDYRLYRKSMAIWLIQQGRYLGGWQGYLDILQAVAYDPSNQRAWKSLWEFSGRALRKAMRLAFMSRMLCFFF